MLNRTFLGLSTLFLAGCLDPGATRDAQSWVAVTKSNVVVAGPPGFCVDDRSTRSGPSDAFVVLGSCAAITRAPLAPQPDIPVVLTASVSTGSATLASPQDWDAYFRSETGRARLSSRGKADEVEILDTRTGDSAFYVLARSRGGVRAQWRGIVSLGGAVATLALRPTGRDALSARARFALIEAFGSRLLAANRQARLSTRQPR